MAGTGAFSNPDVKLGNITEAPVEGVGSWGWGCAQSYALGPGSLCPPVVPPTCAESVDPLLCYILACFPTSCGLWSRLAEGAPIASVNILPGNLLARGFGFVRYIFCLPNR